MIFSALPRLRWISTPEWPPSRPVTVTLRAALSLGARACVGTRLKTVSRPPAQPMHTT